MEPPSPWKRPNEVMHLHRLKKRKKALQERMRQQPLNSSTDNAANGQNPENIDFSRLLDSDKRKNPFSKHNGQQNKRSKLEEAISPIDESNDRTLFALLNLPAKVIEKPSKEIETDKLSTFSNLLQKYTAEHTVEPQTVEERHKYLPIDWSLITRLRLMSPKPFAWNQQLKASEEASGITGFVRCLDTTSSPTLDTSPRALFHQTCLYWQHPNLPWLDLFPRSSGRVAATGFLAANEEVKEALLKDWVESFRSLFQLVRARHCPYFYVCANSFTCLFRAAGVGGAADPSALVTPSTRGLRHTLRQEDVEFTMPLRGDNKKKLNTSDSNDKPKNSSYDSCYDTMDDNKSDNGRTDKADDNSGDEDDMESDQFLSQLGFEHDVIKRINNTQARIQNAQESTVDSAAESLLLVQGADAQALFNFLLNCKSIVSPTGPFAGIPPTLLSPTAFHGGTLQSLKVRESTEPATTTNNHSIELRKPILPSMMQSLLSVVRESTITCDNSQYHSLELRGPILPSTVHSLFRVVKLSSTAQFSATFAHHQPAKAFSWAVEAIHKDESSKENESTNFAKAFNEENLSDSGLSKEMLRHFCSSDPKMVRVLDSIKYNPDDDTYTW